MFRICSKSIITGLVRPKVRYLSSSSICLTKNSGRKPYDSSNDDEKESFNDSSPKAHYSPLDKLNQFMANDKEPMKRSSRKPSRVPLEDDEDESEVFPRRPSRHREDESDVFPRRPSRQRDDESNVFPRRPSRQRDDESNVFSRRPPPRQSSENDYRTRGIPLKNLVNDYSESERRKMMDQMNNASISAVDDEIDDDDQSTNHPEQSSSSTKYSPLDRLNNFMKSDTAPMKRSSRKPLRVPLEEENDEVFPRMPKHLMKENDRSTSPERSSSTESNDHIGRSLRQLVEENLDKRAMNEQVAPVEQDKEEQAPKSKSEEQLAAEQRSRDEFYSSYSKIKRTRAENVQKLLYSNEPVDGEPVPPAKNRYINVKNPALNAFRPEDGIDESKTSFFMFPGQGSQFVGMGKQLLRSDVAKDMFRLSSSILGYNLEEICLQGPEEKLNQTLYAQPAVFVTSLAALEKFRLDCPGVVDYCIGTAGFSLGELTALVFSGTISFEDGLRLVKVRAEEMQKACELTTSGLLTVIYGNDANVEQACVAAADYCKMKGVEESQAVCSVANYLFPHCKVIGGHLEALNFIQTNGKDFGIKRSKRLPVSGAFHTKLMLPARAKFVNALSRIAINTPTKIPVYANFDGMPYLTHEDVKYKLPQQMHCPVKWEQTMFITFTREKHEEHPWIFECGPGTNLTTILKNVNARAYLKAKHIDV